MLGIHQPKEVLSDEIRSVPKGSNSVLGDGDMEAIGWGKIGTVDTRLGCNLDEKPLCGREVSHKETQAEGISCIY
jgi:hypothetical protein